MLLISDSKRAKVCDKKRYAWSVKALDWNDEATEEQSVMESLLRVRWEKYQTEEEAALGRGKRQRKAVIWGSISTRQELESLEVFSYMHQWGAIEWAMMCKHFQRQGKSQYAFHAASYLDPNPYTCLCHIKVPEWWLKSPSISHIQDVADDPAFPLRCVQCGLRQTLFPRWWKNNRWGEMFCDF
nr:hypothetical protein [Tanacetum cinerariifolium]